MHIYVYVHDFLLQVINLMKPESFQEGKCFTDYLMICLEIYNLKVRVSLLNQRVRCY